MPEYIVKYKLEKFGNGFVTPDYIYDGGYVWENNGGISDMILVGKANYKVTQEVPPCVIERITKEQLEEHQDGAREKALKVFKNDQYKARADVLFQEAFREKELGNPKKWEQYLKTCEEIRNIKEIPK